MVEGDTECLKILFVELKVESDKQIDGFFIIRDRKYFITSVQTKFDGDTYVAELELSDEKEL